MSAKRKKAKSQKSENSDAENKAEVRPRASLAPPKPRFSAAKQDMAVEAPRSPRRPRTPKKPSSLSRRTLLYISAGTLIVLLLVILVLNATYHAGFTSGFQKSTDLAREEKHRASTTWNDEQQKELNSAFASLRSNRPNEAFETVSALKDAKPPVPALSYIRALAAMQQGDSDLAERCAKESIEKSERVSDSLALLAVLATQKKSKDSLRDPRAQAEELLRQAIIADPANPYPHYELATLLRYQGRREEALAQIQAAQSRLNPLDSHFVMSVTQSLMQLEATSDADLPSPSDTPTQPDSLLTSSYIAMRRGDFPRAVSLLTQARAILPADVFDYVIYDPAFRQFADESDLRAIWGD